MREVMAPKNDSETADGDDGEAGDSCPNDTELWESTVFVLIGPGIV